MPDDLTRKVDVIIAERAKSNTGWFDRDDLENILIRAVSLQYDTKLKTNMQRLSPPVRCKLSDCLSDIRNVGVTVSPPDREYLRDAGIDTRVDEFPPMACFFDCDERSSIDGSPKDGYNFDNLAAGKVKAINYYASAYFIRQIPKLPAFWRCDGTPDKLYACYSLRCGQKEYDLSRHIGAFDVKGNPIPTYFMDKLFDYRNYRGSATVRRYGKDELWFSTSISYIIQQYNDNKYLWNVTAVEDEAKINIGCYFENVKSLFYARSLPVTETGRKRPILHWVQAHKRRLKQGIDIDIKKYLRGVTEIEMGNTRFTISAPERGISD